MSIILTIDDFSCLKSARFELQKITVLIGPQGSGKSITIKLLYFFIDIYSKQHNLARSGINFDEFKKEIAKTFISWFPPSAWGGKRFNINFTAGDVYMRVLRRTSQGSMTDNCSVTFSDFFKDQYNELLAAYSKVRNPQGAKIDTIQSSDEEEVNVRNRAIKYLRSTLKSDFIANQIFVPAGRAFFTSIGRLVAAFDPVSNLDPVTVRFARNFANLRDFASRGWRLGRQSVEVEASKKEITNKLFGGEIRFERESEHVLTTDGRKVPFTALSSGQQELLPMWLFVETYADQTLFSNQENDLFYIEEPEAHLFPEAQSILMDFLIGKLVSGHKGRHLIITTHSPYILSKINNFIKAGSVARIAGKSEAVTEVVPRECWLRWRDINAYAIDGGKLKSIKDEDTRLIDALYIDSVSEDVNDVFSRLLDIEYI